MKRGSVASDDQFAYFSSYNSTKIYQYEYSREEWVELPECPYKDSGLAIISKDLTTIGGGDDEHDSTKFMKLQQNTWVEAHPPMETAHSCCAVVTTHDGSFLFVIGGRVGLAFATPRVEIFHVNSEKWYRASDLPQCFSEHFSYPSATIHGDQLTVIQYNGKEGYSCTIPPSDQLLQSPLSLSWKALPSLPVVKSTPATLYGQLVLVGGRKHRNYRSEEGDPVNSIHQLVNEEWVKVGTMTESKYDCFVFSPSPDKIIIVGGVNLIPVATVEECTI